MIEEKKSATPENLNGIDNTVTPNEKETVENNGVENKTVKRTITRKAPVKKVVEEKKVIENEVKNGTEFNWKIVAYR